MTLFELNQIIENINRDIYTRWNFFTIIILVIVGGIISLDERIPLYTSLILIVGLTTVFVANGKRIQDSDKSIRIIKEEIKFSMQNNDKNKNIYTEDFKEYLIYNQQTSKLWKFFYIVMSIVAIFLILFNTNFRMTKNKGNGGCGVEQGAPADPKSAHKF